MLMMLNTAGTTQAPKTSVWSLPPSISLPPLMPSLYLALCGVKTRLVRSEKKEWVCSKEEDKNGG